MSGGHGSSKFGDKRGDLVRLMSGEQSLVSFDG